MYSNIVKERLEIEVTNQSEGAMGAFKEIVAKISGDKVYGTMKYEKGSSCARVPQTETQVVFITSASSVVVLPEADEFMMLN